MEVFMTFFKEVREDGGEGLERGEMWREKSEAGVQGTREVKGVLTWRTPGSNINGYELLLYIFEISSSEEVVLIKSKDEWVEKLASSIMQIDLGAPGQFGLDWGTGGLQSLFWLALWLLLRERCKESRSIERGHWIPSDSMIAVEEARWRSGDGSTRLVLQETQWGEHYKLEKKLDTSQKDWGRNLES